MPNGLPYANTNESWEWLSGTASKAARLLGYVPFERIVDERNAPPQIFVPSASPRNVEVPSGNWPLSSGNRLPSKMWRSLVD
jgi:hypothetical protein